MRRARCLRRTILARTLWHSVRENTAAAFDAKETDVAAAPGVAATPEIAAASDVTARRVHVTLHVMNALQLREHEEECRRVVAPRYIVNVKHGPGQLEALGGGLLARELLGVTRDEQLTTNEHGKPFLAVGGPVFNLSNDNGLVVLGILDEGEGPIGVDVNEVPDELDRIKLSIARKYFLPAEVAAVGDGTSFAQHVAFARAWGNLEAALKAMGTGFDFDVRHHREALDEWQLASREIQISEKGNVVAGCNQAATHEGNEVIVAESAEKTASDGEGVAANTRAGAPISPPRRPFVIVVAASKQPQLSVVVHDARADLARFA